VICTSEDATRVVMRHVPSRDGRQLVESGGDDLAGVDQVRNQALIDVQIAFVLPAIAEVMTPGEHSPDLRADPERVR